VQPSSSPSRERTNASRVLLAILALLAAVAIGAAVWVLLNASRYAAASLDPAISASLASQGITVSAPSTTSVPITKEQADTIAFEGSPNRKTVSTTTLAQVRVQPNAAFNCTCWVVSWLLGPGLPPPGGPPGGKPSANTFQSWMRYHVAFIDAQSGKLEFAVESYIPLQPSPNASP
jgi:hypothetical protein